MALVDDLGDELAREVLAAQRELGDDRFWEKVARTIGQLSPTLQESFTTSMRLRMAQSRGQDFVAATLKAAREGAKAPDAPKARQELGSGGH